MSGYQGNIVIKNPATPTGPYEDGTASGIWSLDEALGFIKQGVWPTAGNAQPDPYFKNVTLLLGTNGVNSAQNNTFVDSSSSSLSLTRNGNPTQGSVIPFGTNWSVHFDGATDWLNFSNQSAFAFGTGDFTIECWFMTLSYGTIIVDFRELSSNGAYPLISVASPSGTMQYVVNNAAQITGTTVVKKGEWYHVAVTRTGTTTKMFLNGVQEGSSYVDSNNYIVGADRPIIGTNGYRTDISHFFGYISNFRIVKGTAVYTTNFTPPTAPLTPITNTSLLICANNRFRDTSANNFTINRNGDVKIANFGPFSPSSAYSTSSSGGSMSFDGSGDYLSAANSSVNNLGTNNFTIELWFKSDTGSLNTHACFVASYSSPTSGSWAFKAQSGTSGYIQFASYGPSWNDWVTSTNVAADKSWHHCAVTRSGNTLRIFVDGAVAGTWDITGKSFDGGGHPLTVGFMAQDSTSYINGNISNVRIVNGTALYTAAFTPPTGPLTAVSGTTLLLNGTNAGIFDGSVQNNLETVGNAQVSTAVKKFANASMAFDGSGDYLVIQNDPSMILAGANFTIEAWIYPNGDYSNYRTIISKRILGSSSASYQLYLRQTTGVLSFFNGTEYVSTSTPTANTWSHVAAVYDGTNINLYLNGTRVLQSALTMSDISANIFVGSFPSYNETFNGYIEDMRVTKGIARYTANFTPPTKSFPKL